MFRSLVVVALVLALGGCATTGSGVPAEIVPATIPVGQGIVIAKVTNLQRVSTLRVKWGSFRLKEQTTGKVETLLDQATFGNVYSLFAGPVPAGTYVVESFNADGATPATFGLLPGLIINAMTSSSQRTAAVLTFTVEAGKVTNLGLILSSSGDKPENTAVADAATRESTIAALDAASRARVNAMGSRSWDVTDDASMYTAANTFVRTKSGLVALDFPASGKVLVGTPLGLVYQRDPSGIWVQLSTGSVDNIVLTRELPDGRIFAASDTNRYYVRDVNGQWAAGALPTGLQIARLESLGDKGVAVVAQRFQSSGFFPLENQVLVAADVLQLGSAKPISPAPTEVQGSSLPALFYDGKELLVWTNHFGFSRSGDLYRVDPVTLKSQVEKYSYFLFDMYRMPDGKLARTRMNGLSRFSDYSVDNGVAWRMSEAVHPAIFRYTDDQHAYGLDSSMGLTTVTVTLTKTTDSGRTWTKLGSPIEISGAVDMRQVGNRAMVYTGEKLLSTADDGKTWQIEWPLSK